MSKGKRVLTLAAVLLLAAILAYSYVQQRREAERQARWQAAEDIGIYVLEGVADGRFQVGESYELSQLDPTAEAVRAALSQPFYYVRPVEEDVVLIIGETLFQSVSGYLVTVGTRELPEFYETGVKGLDVGGRVHTGKITEHLYGWTGGL